MILIITHTQDLSADLVIRHLIAKQAPYLRIDTDTIGQPDRHFGFANNSPFLKYDKRTIYPDNVQKVWARRFAKSNSLALTDPQFRDFVARELREAMEAFLDTVDALTVNRFEADRSAGNRLRQSMRARSSGLTVPDTVVTQDNAQAEAFRTSGVTIAKAISFGLLTQSQHLIAHTTDVTETETRGLDVCPVLLQRYVPKLREWRITTVGERAYSACTRPDVAVDKFDWRLSTNVERIFEAKDLPVTVVEKLLTLCDASGIKFGAHDLIETPDHDFVFLETNPAGQWGWLEVTLGLPIGSTLADLLCHPPRG